MKAYPELAAALDEMVGRIDAALADNAYAGPPIKMYLAGGMAVIYYCGTRYTDDVDAEFSRRILLPQDDVTIVPYRKKDGSESYIYLDRNYNSSFALMHENAVHDALPWDGMPVRKHLELRVLAPVDLAVSKIARFLEHDRADIVALAREGLFSVCDLRARALEALGGFVGNVSWVRNSIDIACDRDLAWMAKDAGCSKPKG